MKATIEPGKIKGMITAPPSKSMTQRAYAAALLHNGMTTVINAGVSEDETAALDVVKQLGAKITSYRTEHLNDIPRAQRIEIHSSGIIPASHTLNCGESGLAARLFTPIAALCAQSITIDGKGSLLKRPMQGVSEVFSQLGVSLRGFNGQLPFTVQGPIIPGNIEISAESGSQLLSGLLFALSSCATQPISIAVSHLKSKPYIDLTLDVLAHFGKQVTHENYREFHIDPSRFTPKETVEITIEGDWSSAAYLLVAGAIAGEVVIRNLRPDSKQADRAILTILESAGAAIGVENDTVAVKQAPLHAFTCDATHAPDLFPVLAILGACCDGESYITGVHRLFHKESNRAESISEMLMNFDVPFSIEDDTLCITGVRKLQGTVIDAYNDHRIAMAAAIGALRAGSRVDISQANAIDKSYPAFFKDLLDCGVNCILA